jgi:hypothetical protein
MIIENQFDCRAPRIGGIKKLEEFDKLAATMLISHQRMYLTGEQINSGQQAERAIAFVLVVPPMTETFEG